MQMRMREDSGPQEVATSPSSFSTFNDSQTWLACKIVSIPNLFLSLSLSLKKCVCTHMSRTCVATRGQLEGIHSVLLPGVFEVLTGATSLSNKYLHLMSHLAVPPSFFDVTL